MIKKALLLVYFYALITSIFITLTSLLIVSTIILFENEDKWIDALTQKSFWEYFLFLFISYIVEIYLLIIFNSLYKKIKI